MESSTPRKGAAAVENVETSETARAIDSTNPDRVWITVGGRRGSDGGVAMRRIFLMVSGLTLAFAIAIAGTASGDTMLGSTSQPSGSTLHGCGTNEVVNQVTSDPSTPYSVPGSGTITQWQTFAAPDTPGAPVMLVVLRPVGASFSVVGADAQTIPNPAPAVASYTLATPIQVSGGETLGLYTNSSGSVGCYFSGGSTPAADTLAGLGAPSQPAPGQTLNRVISDSPGGYTMNLAANFVPAPTGQRAAALKSCKKRAHKHHWSHKRLKKCKRKANLLPV
jgi:hypothetical protein